MGRDWDGVDLTLTFFAVGSVCAGYHFDAFCEWCGTERSPFLPNFFVLLSCAGMVDGLWGGVDLLAAEVW